jgi:hypothetical protein
VEVVANIRQYSRSNKGKTNPCTNKITSPFTKETTIATPKQQSVEMQYVFPSGLSWQTSYSVNSNKWGCMLPAQRLKHNLKHKKMWMKFGTFYHRCEEKKKGVFPLLLGVQVQLSVLYL